MAAGDTFSSAPVSVAAGATMNIQPAAGTEAVIHNLYYAGAVQVYWTDGTNTISFFSDSVAGSLLGSELHVTSTKYIQIKNTGSAAIYVAYDGIVTSGSTSALGPNDDDFLQNSSGVPSGWTAFNSPAIVDTNSITGVPGGFLHIKSGAAQASADNWQGIYKAAPAIPYTVTLKISDTTPTIVNYCRFGLLIMDGTTTSKLLATGPQSSSAIISSAFTSWTLDNNDASSSIFAPALYVRAVVHSPTNIDMAYSFNGTVWTYTRTATNWLVNANYVGIGISPYSQVGEMACDWIKFS